MNVLGEADEPELAQLLDEVDDDLKLLAMEVFCVGVDSARPLPVVPSMSSVILILPDALSDALSDPEIRRMLCERVASLNLGHLNLGCTLPHPLRPRRNHVVRVARGNRSR